VPQSTEKETHIHDAKGNVAGLNIVWLRYFNELTRDLHFSTLPLDQSLRVLFDSLLQRLGVDAAAIWTIEEDTKFTKIESSRGLSDRYVRFFNKTDRIRVGKGLVGRVVAERETLYFSSLDEYKDIGISRWNVMLREEGVVSILAAPMFVGAIFVGALTIYYKHEHAFSERERLFMEVLANYLAAIIENVKNYSVIKSDSEELKNEINKLLELQQVVQSLDVHISESIDATLRTLSEYVHEKFRATGIAIFREQDEDLRLHATYNLPREYISYLKEHPYKTGTSSIISRSFVDERAVVADRVFTDEHFDREQSTLMSIVGRTAMGVFPLKVQERVTGVLAVYYDHIHKFSEDEISILNTFAQFLGVSLENLRIFQSLSSEKEKTLSILNSLNDGILVYNLDGNIIQTNPKTEGMLVLSRESLIGLVPAQLAEDPDPARKSVAAISTLRLSDFESQEIIIETPSKVHLRVTHVPLVGENKKKIGSMRILHDITQEKEVEILKSNFVSTVSHQLRTPLTGIKWGIDSLSREAEGGLGEEQRKLTERITASTESLIDLVNDLLDVSRIEEGRFEYKFEMESIESLVRTLIEEFRAMATQKHIEISFEPSHEKLPEVLIDERKFKIALGNIIDNSVKYTPDNGSIKVQLNLGKDSLIIVVSDTGIGISKDNKALIFNKFYRSDEAVKMHTDGSGLGLFIAKQIIDRHNGKIVVDSQIGTGSKFYVHLPIQTETLEQNIKAEQNVFH
jgi:PAS domain S-box-containing protein